VVNAAGTSSATATRMVVVYQSGLVTSTFSLYTAWTNGTAAEETAADLTRGAPGPTAAARQEIRSRLGALGQSLADADIVIAGMLNLLAPPREGFNSLTCAALPALSVQHSYACFLYTMGLSIHTAFLLVV
jgi:hypothetical protein